MNQNLFRETFQSVQAPEQLEQKNVCPRLP